MSTTNGLRCAECAARMAHDQRYCLECGARRGPLPAQISALIGAIHERGPAAAVSAETGSSEAESLGALGARPPWFEFVMPGPRAAAVAVMGMLAFGVSAGSLVGGASIETLASAPLIVVGLAHPTAAAHVVQAAGPAPQDGASGAAAPAVTSASATASPPAPAPVSASPSASPAPSGNAVSSPAASSGLPPVKHVFLIVLSDRGFQRSFGAGDASGYLGGALRRQGELVQNYYAVAGAPLANEIALISGQGPTAQTAADCPTFTRVRPARKGRRGQVLGSGCLYPRTTKTLADQLSSAGESWRVYGTACHIPRVGSAVAQARGAWRDPFLYFRSLSACGVHHGGFGRLAADLKRETSTPTLAYIVPAPCADASEAPCRPGATPGLAGANRFLRSIVPEIRRSPAYRAGGLIAITFDQAPQSGADADPSACCANPSYPNLRRLAPGTPPVPPAATGMSPTTSSTTPTTPAPSLGAGETTPTGGGGQVGLLLISRYVKPGSIDVVDYFNHFSLLATIENLFGLHRLGYAGGPGLPVMGLPVFNKYGG